MQPLYTDLQLDPTWEKHTGPDISGEANPRLPDSYGWDDSFPPAKRFSIAGKQYSCWLAAIHKPLPAGWATAKQIAFGLNFDLMVDLNTQNFAQALEFDTRISIAGLNYNFSSQLNYASGGRLQLSNATEGWVDSGFEPGKLIAGRWVHFEYDYFIDTVKKIYSTKAIRVEDLSFSSVPASLSNLPALDKKWGDSLTLQVQQDLSQNGSYSHMIKNVDFIG